MDGENLKKTLLESLEEPECENLEAPEIKLLDDKILTRKIKISNPEDIDVSQVLQLMLKRTFEKHQFWTQTAQRLRSANFMMISAILFLQAVLVIILNSPEIFPTYERLLKILLPSISAFFIAFQQKLSWNKKMKKAKKSE